MWNVKHFRTQAALYKWVEARSVEWYRIFVENKAYSIEYRPLVSPRMPR